jgi:hypothetical protein
MNDDQLLRAFESAAIDPDSFGHAEHIRLAWLYLERGSLWEAAAKLTAGLQRLTAVLGVGEKYHETVTLAWLFLINERRAVTDQHGWAAFRAAHPDLFENGGATLGAYYRPETLRSGLARRIFVLPDRAAAAGVR